MRQAIVSGVAGLAALVSVVSISCGDNPKPSDISSIASPTAALSSPTAAAVPNPTAPPPDPDPVLAMGINGAHYLIEGDTGMYNLRKVEHDPTRKLIADVSDLGHDGSVVEVDGINYNVDYNPEEEDYQLVVQCHHNLR
jgi:hypothetical protein|tara:strand:- start:390 stop:806 length:417 start_codon:yes stop_codon:yes gene_type:complete